MEDIVSQIENNTEDNFQETYSCRDFCHTLKIQYRLAKKRFLSFFHSHLKKNFTDILYITPETAPTDYIIAMQKQYPDKVIKVLIPLFNDENNKFEKTSIKFDYFLQGRKSNATLYHIPAGYNNINIYGIYTEELAKLENKNDIYKLKNLARYTKIARKCALKLKPDIIHAYNIPFLLGLELESRWKTGFPIKYAQFVHDYQSFPDEEPFIAAITLANEEEIKKICSDSTIKNCLATIFKTEQPKTIKKTKGYINYILKKYDEYRKNVDTTENTKENVALWRMNERTLKIFPKMTNKDNKTFNSMYFSMQKASKKIIHCDSNNKPEWAKSLADIISLPLKLSVQDDSKIHNEFNIDNFREVRFLNKRYIIREFSQKRIELKFIDFGIFKEDNTEIRGYLDSYYSAPLFLFLINEYTGIDDIKTATLALLKAFEMRKTLQVIYNFPKGLDNNILHSLFDFFESQPALSGKWVAVEGMLNKRQFLSAADMILIPSGNYLGAEDIFYAALKNGCIPILSKSNCPNSLVSDIFDDLNTGCVFKNGELNTNNDTEYETVFLKALEFYTNNTSSWNVIIKNALNYECGWDFETIEKYNNLYNELI